ncbi:hypothetical protein BHM03_00030266 [Ensete ventricosum]|nr:hypothetical protein BHM03_00030266 [Ensete ventricosum]
MVVDGRGGWAALEGATIATLDLQEGRVSKAKRGCEGCGWQRRKEESSDTPSIDQGRLRLSLRREKGMVADGEGQRLAVAANRLRQRETKVARLGAAAIDLGWVQEEEAAVARMVGVRAAAVGLQRLQWEMAGMVGGDKKVGRNYGGRRRKKQPRERKEAVASV